MKNTSDQKLVQKLEENNGFQLGGIVDIARVPQDRSWMVLSNHSFLFILTYDSERFVSVCFFKDSRQVKEMLLDLRFSHLTKPIVTNCDKLMLAQDKRSLTIVD